MYPIGPYASYVDDQGDARLIANQSVLRVRNIASASTGIRGILDFCRQQYRHPIAENTRETYRRQTIHQFVSGGIALINPDKASRPTNSPKTVYQIATSVLALVKKHGTDAWQGRLARVLARRQTLVAHYAKERKQAKVPVRTSDGRKVELSPGEYSELIKAIVEDFAPRFSGAMLIYVGDTGKKWGYFDTEKLVELGVDVGAHGPSSQTIESAIRIAAAATSAAASPSRQRRRHRPAIRPRAPTPSPAWAVVAP